jgi:hypothetical protein
MTATKKATRKLGSNPGAKTEEINSTRVTTSAQPSNSNPARRIIRCQDDVLLYDLGQGNGRANSYEVVSPSGDCWRFSLLYEAEAKFERLAARKTA